MRGGWIKVRQVGLEFRVVSTSTWKCSSDGNGNFTLIYTLHSALIPKSKDGSEHSYVYQLQQIVKPVHFLSKNSGQGVKASLRILDEKALRSVFHLQNFWNTHGRFIRWIIIDFLPYNIALILSFLKANFSCPWAQDEQESGCAHFRGKCYMVDKGHPWDQRCQGSQGVSSALVYTGYVSLTLPCTPMLHLVTWSYLTLFVTPWTLAHLAPLSMGFSGQDYWSGVPFPSPRHLPDPGIEPMSLCLLLCRQILYHWATGEALHVASRHLGEEGLGAGHPPREEKLGIYLTVVQRGWLDSEMSPWFKLDEKLCSFLFL